MKIDIGKCWDKFISYSNHTLITKDDKSTALIAGINILLQALDFVYESDTKAIKTDLATEIEGSL